MTTLTLQLQGEITSCYHNKIDHHERVIEIARIIQMLQLTGHLNQHETYFLMREIERGEANEV